MSPACAYRQNLWDFPLSPHPTTTFVYLLCLAAPPLLLRKNTTQSGLWSTAFGPADTVPLSQTNGRTRMEHAIPMNCHIRIKGHLDSSWREWFEGLEIVQEPEGTTLFSGPLVDQAALHGILAKIRGLGLDLLSFEALPQDEPGEVC